MQLTDDEMAALMSRYDVRGDGTVYYRDFEDTIDAVFTQKGLERSPTKRVSGNEFLR